MKYSGKSMSVYNQNDLGLPLTERMIFPIEIQFLNLKMGIINERKK